MSKKIKVLIAIGGTGGHVFPGCHLAEHLNDKGYSVKILTDKRGKKFLKNYNNFNIKELPSLPINTKNILSIFISSIQIMYSIIRSLIYLIYNRPSIIFGMGGYASFPICIAATMLKVKFQQFAPTLKQHIQKMSIDARKIDGVTSFIPVRAGRVYSRIYR